MDAPVPLPKPPSTIPVVVLLWVVVEVFSFFVDRPPDRPPGLAWGVAEILSFVYGFIVIALVAQGLVRGSRIVWGIALLWQALRAGFGIINLTANDYELGFSPTTSSFYNGWLPIIVAAVSFLLLLAPATRNWLKER